MESTFRHSPPTPLLYFLFCFNPCFNGINIQTLLHHSPHSTRVSFNPCFNGINIQTLKMFNVIIFFCYVSILVLMESTFRHFRKSQKMNHSRVSILVLMESTFRPQLVQFLLLHQTQFQSLF